jgi:polyphosphate glucokinase
MAKVFDYGDNHSMAAKKKASRTPARRKGPEHQRIGAPRKGTRHASTADGGARRNDPRRDAPVNSDGTALSGDGGRGTKGGGIGAKGRGAKGGGKGAEGRATKGTGKGTNVGGTGTKGAGKGTNVAGTGTKRASAPRTDTPRLAPQRILVLDVGGSHVKLRVGDRGNPKKFVTGPKMSAAAMAKAVRKLFAADDYDAVSIGYPGLVIRGRIAAEPFNLGSGWMGFDFEKAFGKPVRIVNDAAMQAVGSYRGGRMLFLGLGTGMGATLILDGVVEPMEFGHLPYKNGRTYEQYVGERALERLGKKKWRKEVAAVVAQLSHALEVDYTVLGGGNVRLLKKLPKGARPGANSNAMTGGRLIWEAAGSPLVLSGKYRDRAAKQGRPA